MSQVKYINGIDGLRAIAILIVLLAHAKVPYLLSGGVGVDIFFVLSGFLITTILETEYQSSSNINLKNFYFRRALRLFPCLVVVCILFAIAELIIDKSFPFVILGTVFTYTSNWARALFNYDLKSLAHTWSLAIEEQYYLLWPLTILFLNRASFASLKKLYIIISLVVLVGLYRWIVADWMTSERVYFGTDTHSDGLLLGSSLVYLIGTHKARTFRFASFISPIALSILIIVPIVLTWESAWMQRYGNLFVILLSSVVVIDLAVNGRSILNSFLASPILLWIGKISYGLYVWHYPLFAWINQLEIAETWYSRVFLKLSLLFLVASFSYYFIELKFLKMKSLYQENRNV